MAPKSLKKVGCGIAVAGQAISEDEVPESTFEEFILDACESKLVSELLFQDESNLIDEFVTRAHELVEPWEQQRLTTDLLFDMKPLNDAFDEFLFNITSTERFTMKVKPSVVATPDFKERLPTTYSLEIDNPAVWMVRYELIRRLNYGCFRDYLAEIVAYSDEWGRPKLAILLGLSAKSLKHKYQLFTVIAGDVSVGKVVEIGATISKFRIRYSNSAGMKWSITLVVPSAGGKAGLAVHPLPGSANITSSYGNDGLSSATLEPARYYFSPEDFENSWTRNWSAGGTFVGGVGAAKGSLTFQTGEGRGKRRLKFDTTGAHFAIGTDMAGSAGGGVDAGVTVDMDVESRTVPPAATKVPLSPSKTVPILDDALLPRFRVQVYFATGGIDSGGADLTPSAHEKLELLNRALLAHNEVYEGDIFDFSFFAGASMRWVVPRKETPEGLNAKLCVQRAKNVMEKMSYWMGMDCPAPYLKSITVGRLWQVGRCPGDNAAQDRRVVVDVSYRPCHPDGNFYNATHH